MKAALRDAKRTEAIQLRPKGSTMAHDANGRRERAKTTCYICGAEMVTLGGRAKGGICRNCTLNAKRMAVVKDRAEWAKRPKEA